MVFHSEAEDRDHLALTVLETLRTPGGTTTKWTRGPVAVGVEVAGAAAGMARTGFDAR